ncbi:MAG: mechanosensitive ion channel family protein [Acidimicrobiia bacterium]|nr:mechanosensitive ion channel family protein [Acidimicrobiia bacterium]
MQWLADQMNMDAALLGKYVGSAIVFIAILLARWLGIRMIHKNLEGEPGYRAQKLTNYLATFLLALTLGWIWLDAFDNLATYLGLASAGVAIGLSDLLKNMAGWLYILARRPFRIDDRIEIDGTRGDVIDIRLFRFSLMEIGAWVDADQSTGRIMHIPNGLVFTNKIANYIEGLEYIWHEIPVLVTFESDWRAARSIIQDAVQANASDVEKSGAQIRRTARSYHIKLGKLTPIVYMTVRDSGVLLTGRYLVNPRARRSTEEHIWTAILDGFAAHEHIDLAYPTTRTYLQGPVQMQRVDQADPNA